MRVWVLLLLVACGEPPLPVEPLPALAAEPAARPEAIPASARRASEEIAWQVSWRGLDVGVARVVAGPDGGDIGFRTGGFAAQLASVEFALRTDADPDSGLPRASASALRFGGSERRTATMFDGAAFSVDDGETRRAPAPVHSLDTALVALRAWAAADGAGTLYVVHERDLYRLDARVDRADDGLRVDARIVPIDDDGAPLPLTVWLADDGWQTPARIEIDHPRGRVLAEHIEL